VFTAYEVFCCCAEYVLGIVIAIARKLAAMVSSYFAPFVLACRLFVFPTARIVCVPYLALSQTRSQIIVPSRHYIPTQSYSRHRSLFVHVCRQRTKSSTAVNWSVLKIAARAKIGAARLIFPPESNSNMGIAFMTRESFPVSDFVRSVTDVPALK
jgi:hypothetical protein